MQVDGIDLTHMEVIETFLAYHHERGLSKRRYAPEDMFVPETLTEDDAGRKTGFMARHRDDEPDAAHGCDLALIRPDQHVAWRGSRLPADCDAHLARVTGHSA